MAGIAVGNAATGDTDPQGFLLGHGVAPGAQFGSVNVISTGGVLADDLRVESCVNNGAQVMNNSWGAAVAAGYTGRSATFDQKVRDPDDGAAGLEYLVIVCPCRRQAGAVVDLYSEHELEGNLARGGRAQRDSRARPRRPS